MLGYPRNGKAPEYAHNKGIIHRDIKPSNVMLLSDGSIKLLDFGLARYVNSQTNMTATGQFMGTVDYVSPEQALDTRNVDHRADIYSLGCTFYFLLTGRAPFDGAAYDSIVSKILAHTEETAVPIHSINPSVPKTVSGLVERMMAKSPADRFQSAQEVIAAVSKYAHPKTINSRPTANSRHVQSTSDDLVDKVFDNLVAVLWIIARTALSCVGLVERVEVANNSRLGAVKQYRWQFAPKGIVILAVILFFLSMFVFGNVVVVETL
jgi:serine/threonine protein kinase